MKFFFETHYRSMQTFFRMMLLSSMFSLLALELGAQVLGEASSDDIRERPREISFRSIEIGITPYAALQPLSDNTARLPFVITRATLSALARLDNTMLYIDYSVGNIPDFPDAVTMVSGGASLILTSFSFLQQMMCCDRSFALPVWLRLSVQALRPVRKLQMSTILTSQPLALAPGLASPIRANSGLRRRKQKALLPLHLKDLAQLWVSAAGSSVMLPCSFPIFLIKSA
jgi:hypothetical protein